ncbi:hypothetical protein R3P38DRAFT_2813055 [Favolaschia claudopus]|uniref:Uncharacterized protein n=1 Tax=Favolaschia claudopus TaxID=2862362 RepID=A0AAV9Z6M8_9AGAR
MVLFALLAAAVGFCGILAQHAHAQSIPIPSLTPQQAVAMQAAMVTQADTSDTQDKITTDVANAAAVAVGISQNFTNIGASLQAIDNENLQSLKFFPTWQGFSNTYNELLQQSKNLAAVIAGYADQYDEAILLLVSDDTISVEDRITIVNGFIAQTSAFNTTANALALQFQDLVTDIGEFKGNFNDFAATRSASDTMQIESLITQIGQLKEEVAAIQASTIGLAIGAGAGVIGTVAALAFFPEAAPFIVIGAAIAEGLIAATEIGLAVTKAGNSRLQ